MRKKNKKRILIILLTAFLIVGIGMNNVMAIDEITVAYFPGWPGTQAVGWAKGWFDQEMGVKVNWREFDTGVAILTAMASGDVQIGFALGSIPVSSALSQGFPIKMVGVAEAFSGKIQNLIVRDGTGISTPKDLVGKIIGVPFGTNPHLTLIELLEICGIKENQVKLIDMAPQDIVAAFQRGDVDAGISWEPFTSEMINYSGHEIISGETLDMWGLVGLDTVTVLDKFAKKYPELLIKFLKVWDKSTKYYRENPDESHILIGEKIGISAEKTKNIMKDMIFLTAEEHLSPNWLGSKGKPGRVPERLKGIADFLVKRKSLEKALDDYSQFVDPSFLEKIAGK